MLEAARGLGDGQHMINIIENIDFTPPLDPWDLFDHWFLLATQHEINDPNAMALATVGEDGMPSVRIMLLKEHDRNGFIFYTNRHSRKGEQLLGLRAALCWHWKSLRRQIRAEGLISIISDQESDLYFSQRPRGSQIGAWASQQSQYLENRSILEERVRSLEERYKGKVVPRPPYWGGYKLTPLRIEFWQDRAFRLHDRFLYKRSSDKEGWSIERLYP